MRKYFATYNDVEGVEHHFDIFVPSYSGEATQVTGYVEHEYLQVDETFEAIRSSALVVHLDANTNLTFDDLYDDIEQQIEINYYRDGQVKFKGYINPDGIFQDWVSDRWELTLDASDGLGYLSDVAFSPLGLDLEISEIQVISQCLQKTGLTNSIYTNIPFKYLGQTASTDPLTEVFIRREVFIKEDKETLMSCEEALRIVLEKYMASIYQEDGRWVITTLPMINNGSNNCYVYNSNGAYQGLGSHASATIVGSQINDFYPHHCSANQKIEVRPAINTFRINSKFGDVASENENPNLINSGLLTVNGWTVYPGIADPINPGIVKITISNDGNADLAMETTIANQITEGEVINFDIRSSDSVVPGATIFNYNIRVQIIAVGSTNTYYLRKFIKDSEPIWTTSINDFLYLKYQEPSIFQTDSFEAPPLPETATISIKLYSGIVFSATPRETLVDMMSLTVLPATDATGKSYTFNRKPKISSVIRDTETLNVGSYPVNYVGALLRSDKETGASLWSFRDSSLYAPLEKRMGQVIMESFQKPQRVFTGNVYGPVRYPGIYQIDGITGRFIITNYKHNTLDNITEVEAIEFFDTLIPDSGYSYSENYIYNDQDINPTIEE